MILTLHVQGAEAWKEMTGTEDTPIPTQSHV